MFKSDTKKLIAEKQNFLFDFEKDFTRFVPLGFVSIIEMIIYLECGLIREEFLKYYDFHPKTITAFALLHNYCLSKYSVSILLFS